MYADHEKKVKHLEEVLGADDINLHLDGFIDIILDAIGVPADNTVETSDSDIANATSERPKSSYCRYYYHETWWDTVESWPETTVVDFLAWVHEQLKADGLRI